MHTDKDIRTFVIDELEWQPGLSSRDIAVSVDKGVVSLTGFVTSYTSKYDAEEATKRVAGVRGIANDLEVRIPDIDARPDPEIARDIVSALSLHLPLHAKHLTTTVKNGWVTLEGEVEWDFERRSAEHSAHAVRGVVGISNLITVRPRANASDIKGKIEAAFKRNAEVDGARVKVSASGGAVTLTGEVSSWNERDEAERVAWLAPGVVSIDDRLVVNP